MPELCLQGMLVCMPSLKLSSHQVMASLPKSPLAPKAYPYLPLIPGVQLGAMEASIKYKGRHDLALWLLDEGTTVAGTFTKSKTAGAPVQWCQESLKGGRARAIVVNSGNSNALQARRAATRSMPRAGQRRSWRGAKRPRSLSHRRVLSASRSRQTTSHLCCLGCSITSAGPVGRGRSGHHDHRHLPEECHGHGYDWLC